MLGTSKQPLSHQGAVFFHVTRRRLAVAETTWACMQMRRKSSPARLLSLTSRFLSPPLLHASDIAAAPKDTSKIKEKHQQNHISHLSLQRPLHQIRQLPQPPHPPDHPKLLPHTLPPPPLPFQSLQNTIPINPQTPQPRLPRRPMIMEQTLRHMADLLFLNPVIRLQVIEQVGEIAERRLVAADVFGQVRGREGLRAAAEGTREGAGVGGVVHVCEGDEAVVGCEAVDGFGLTGEKRQSVS